MQQALYRKWRPQTFAALHGQDAIRDTLLYALTHGQTSQSYLFCGPRGTGKTTTARLVAKVVNCQSNQDTKPCNACAACRSITNGANLDILEIDAASNRGIDEIRQLRDSVRFTPTQARYKVFIIDEVHMLTREAFNALLKTLEEPPAHALFILATTESHKIPPTILSRCQRYDFRPADAEILSAHMLSVAKEEGLNVEPEAARFLAHLAEGSFRDALTLLDQIRSHKTDRYTLSVVEQLFGYVERDFMEACLAAILSGNSQLAHDMIDRAMARGVDLRALCGQMLSVSEQCLEAVALGDCKGLGADLAQVCRATSLADMVDWTELLLAAAYDTKQSPIARLSLDLAIAKFQTKIAPQTKTEPSSLVQPPAQESPLEENNRRSAMRRTEEIGTWPAESSKQETAAEIIEIAPKATATATVAVPVAETLETALSSDQWTAVLKGLKQEAPSLMTSLAQAKVLGVEGGALIIAVQYKMHADKINQTKNQQKIEAVIAEILGRTFKVEGRVVKDLVIEEEAADIAAIFEFEE